MGIVISVSAVVSALATVGIFLFTRLNFMIYKELQKKQGEQQQKFEEQQQRFNDLFEGIVIATLLSGPSSTGDYKGCKEKFLQEYKGKTQIFKE